MNLFIHAFIQQIHLELHCKAGTILIVGEPAGNKVHKILVLKECILWLGETDNPQISK